MIVHFLHTGDTTAEALVDTGATHNFLSPEFAKQYALQPLPLQRPRVICNVNGTTNKGGEITHYIDLNVTTGDHPHHWFRNQKHRQRFYVADLGNDRLILGYPWVAATQLNLNWSEPAKNPIIIVGPIDWLPEETLHEGDEIIMRIQQTTHAQKLAEAAHDKTPVPWTDRVPEELHQFEDVFSKQAAHRFPTSKPWDHAIELLPNAPPVLDCKVYPLSQDEQTAQDAFLKEHLDKNYIRPSKSPYAAPFFFVKKKGGCLRPVQDYRRLNSWTRKNRYTLPLISELVNKAPGHTWYSTMDV